MPTIHDDLTAGEPLVRLTELPAETYMPRRGGRTLDRSIPFRWHQTGKGGVRLEAIRTPGGLATTRPAVLRFFAALTDPDAAARPPSRTPRRRAADQAAAERALSEAGIG